MKTELITVPTFTFEQGSFIDGDTDAEIPVSVDFYNGTIILRQTGNYDQQEEIKISPAYFEKLFKEIRKHKIEADKYLSMKS